MFYILLYKTYVQEVFTDKELAREAYNYFFDNGKYDFKLYEVDLNTGDIARIY